MSSPLEVKVPDIGDFTDVEIIEVLVAPGATVAAEDPLITLETDKAAMDVPAPAGGTVIEVAVAVGDRVSQGSTILLLETAQTPEASVPEPSEAAPALTERSAPERSAAETAGEAPQPPAQAHVAGGFHGQIDVQTQLLVLGAGPGGYTAAFRAADLGLQVCLVERWPTLGGVCLNVGCIPSKALLHAAKVIEDAQAMGAHGVAFAPPAIDTDQLRHWKDGVIGRLTAGLSSLAKQRKVQVLQGTGQFLSAHHLAVDGQEGRQVVAFEHCVIAAGSEAARIPDLPGDPRIMDSTGALELEELPERMLVVGGGIIGLEMATVYAALGVKVSVVELTASLMPGCDRDLVRPLQQRIAKLYEQILLGTRVSAVEALEQGIRVTFEGAQAPEPQVYGRVLIAVGRRPNGPRIAAQAAGVQVEESGFIRVDAQMRTNVAHIFAIGDIVGEPMLAHKATHEGKVAAEVISGKKRAFDARVIPSVAYTDPEIAWVGLTETEAKARDVKYAKGVFPWLASGRSLALGREEGLTKILFDPASKRVLGVGIVGTSAGDLISEAALAIEMGCDAADLGLTIHPHPTLSETVAMAAEAFEGTLTDLYVPRRDG